MVAPLVIAGEVLGATIVPLILEAFTRPDGPSDEDRAKIKAVIDREAAQRAARMGMPLSQALEEVQAELGPALEKGFTQEPGIMQSLLTWGGGGIAGALGGRKVAGTLARRSTLKNSFRPDVRKQAQTLRDQRAARTPAAASTQPGMSGMDPDDIARLEANRSMGTTSQSIDVDAILRRGMPTRPAAAAPAITKPGAKGKIAALKNKPAAATPEEAAAAADIEAMKGFKPSAPLSGAADPVAAARRDATNAARAARGLPLLPDPAEIEARVAARYA